MTKDKLFILLERYKVRTGKSLEVLGREMGISYFTVMRWLNGKTKPTPIYRKMVSEYLRQRGVRHGQE